MSRLRWTAMPPARANSSAAWISRRSKYRSGGSVNVAPCLERALAAGRRQFSAAARRNRIWVSPLVQNLGRPDRPRSHVAGRLDHVAIDQRPEQRQDPEDHRPAEEEIDHEDAERVGRPPCERDQGRQEVDEEGDAGQDHAEQPAREALAEAVRIGIDTECLGIRQSWQHNYHFTYNSPQLRVPCLTSR